MEINGTDLTRITNITKGIAETRRTCFLEEKKMLAHGHFSGIKRVSDSKDIITLFWFLFLFSIIQLYTSTLCTGLVRHRSKLEIAF